MEITFTTSRDKISSVSGYDSVSVTFSADEEYSSFECRATKEGAEYGEGIGALIASFSQTPANTERTFEIYDDYLLNGDGVYRISLYAENTVYTATDGFVIESGEIRIVTAGETTIKDGAIYTPADFETPLKLTLNVTVNPVTEGVMVSAERNGVTISGDTDSEGKVTLELPSFGLWSVSAGGEPVLVSASEAKSYEVTANYTAIYGVTWDGSSSTILTRTDDSSLFADPVAAVGTGEGSSPFDNIYPWSAMEEYNIIDGVVTYKKGDANFSRTLYDTVVYIPEFWYQASKDESTGIYTWKIAGNAADGFEKHPGSGKYVAKYNTGASYVSKSGLAPLTNITRNTARAGSTGKGSGWYLYDFMSWCAVWLLFLVEFANWDSQTAVGRGIVDGSSTSDIQKTGATDSMAYHTGRAAGTDGKTAVQYRGIENPWGNVWEWIDGANFSERAAYICTNPANYADDTSTNYTAAGVTLPSSGWTKTLGMSAAFPWAYLPDANGGSATTCIPDYVYSGTGWRVLMVGGNYGHASNAGLWCFHASNASSNSDASIGARLMFDPNLSA